MYLGDKCENQKSFYGRILGVAAFLGILGLSLADNSTSGEVADRIYGGQRARLGQFPFQARLDISSRGGSFICGGSLISDRWVVTAAHCLDGATSVSVRLGMIDTTTSGQRSVSREFYKHPRYDPFNIVNDIGVIKLPLKVTLNSNVKPIRLPKKSQAPVSTFEGLTGVVSGWGRTTNWQSGGTRYLQFANAKVMSHTSCEKYYRQYSVGNGEICTSNAATNSGTCQGDSGGPLSVVKNNQRILIGVTSWGVDECRSRAPSVYTNVAAFLGFINAKTGIAIS